MRVAAPRVASLALLLLPVLPGGRAKGAAPELRSHGLVREEDPWVPGRVLVAPRTGVDPARLARRHGARLASPPGPSGWVALTWDGTRPRADLLARLTVDRDVRLATLEGRTYGTSGAAVPFAEGPAAMDAVPRAHLRTLQWHRAAVDPMPVPQDLGRVTVAVLDTGVAYEDRVDARRTWRRAGSLRCVRFVAPADFIEHDGHPNDDHQHGTHIASLVAGCDALPGVAPGVRLMPVKVLDHEDVGTELALVDGIHHAVEHGAHVVNMSLSFGPGYVAGPALVEALERAAHADVVLVAAAGNEGGEVVTQPAASPLVVAVGALRPIDAQRLAPAGYSNASPRVDLASPGGALDADRNGDGIVDGILAETIALQHPSSLGWWLYAGTSQAAALVSAAAAHLVRAGLDAPRVRAVLEGTTRPEPLAGQPWVDGHGSGRLSLAAARDATHGEVPPPPSYFVALLPWLEAGTMQRVRPRLRAVVLDAQARRAAGVTLVGSLEGTGGTSWACRTDGDGTCSVDGHWRTPRPEDRWTWRAEGVVADGVSWRPGAAAFINRGLQALLGAMDRDGTVRGAVLGFRWRAGRQPELGAVADGVALVDLDTLRGQTPRARLLVNGTLEATPATASGSLAISAATAGLAPSVRLVPHDGGGAWGWRLLRTREGARPLLVLDAVALAASPLDVTAPGLYGGLGRGWTPMLVGTGPMPGPVATNRRNGLDLTRTPVGAWLEAGGWPAWQQP
jgi:hypothetical protein